MQGQTSVLRPKSLLWQQYLQGFFRHGLEQRVIEEVGSVARARC
jgi:hypothetical protein